MSDITAVVTGASSGTGTAVTHALGRVGATVVACARDDDALQSVVNDIECDSGSASIVRVDVRDEFDVECPTEIVARIGGRINVLVTDAAVAHGTPGEMPAPEDSYVASDDTLRTNVHDVLAAVKRVLPYMADDGRVLVPSGSIAREAEPGMSVYTISKMVAEALVRQFAADCDRTVTIADPSFAATDSIDGQGHGPDDVADLFVWAAADTGPAELDGDIAGLKAWKRAMH